MNFGGTYEISAPPELIFDFITDPNRIGKCLPDLKSLETEGEDNFRAIVRIGVGFMRGDFDFQISIIEKMRPHRVRLKGIGSGSGSEAKIDTEIELTSTANGTNLVYKAKVELTGLFAGLAQGILLGMVEKTVNQLFDCVKTKTETKN